MCVCVVVDWRPDCGGQWSGFHQPESSRCEQDLAENVKQLIKNLSAFKLLTMSANVCVFRQCEC